MALSLFRFIAALGRTQVVANTLGTFTLLMVFVLGGFIIAKGRVTFQVFVLVKLAKSCFLFLISYIVLSKCLRTILLRRH